MRMSGIKNIFQITLKTFGYLYFLLNAVMFAVILIMIASFYARPLPPGGESAGWILLVIPILGLAAGAWIRHGRFGILRILAILASFLVTAAILFIAFFVSPAIEKIHKTPANHPSPIAVP
jgi:hypothetical protein